MRELSAAAAAVSFRRLRGGHAALVKPGKVEFEPGDALLVIDVLDDFDHEDGMSLLESFRERGPTMAAAIKTARDVGIPVIYVNDDRDRWDGDAPALAREAAEGPGADIIRELLPQAGDRVLLKHRYSAFDHTALELLLEAESVQRVLVVGATTEGCVAQTALDAREHGLKVTILRDSCATVDADREELALRYAEEVGGIRVRSLGPVPGAGGSRKGFSVGGGGTSGEMRSVLEEGE